MAMSTPSDTAVGECHRCETAIFTPTNTRIAPNACER
jgi:hypothetical protein